MACAFVCSSWRGSYGDTSMCEPLTVDASELIQQDLDTAYDAFQSFLERKYDQGAALIAETSSASGVAEPTEKGNVTPLRFAKGVQ